MNSEKKMKVYLIAGEPSGDLLGARLMRALKKQRGENVSFAGIGGEEMQAEGLKSLFDIADLAVMGFMEVIPSIPVILKHLNEIVEDIRRVKPDIVMTIDSYSFSIRVHKKLKADGITIPHVHCVAPQVWAWKQGRSKTMGDFVDHLFCLLPNEADYFRPHGLETTFIGHPVIEGGADKGNGEAFRKKYNIPPKAVVLCVLPGSRKNEIRYLLPTFKESAEEILEMVPNLFVVVPTVSTVSDKLKAELEGWKVPHVIVEGEKERYDAFAAADVGLAASGTVSLELAMAGVPHLIAYKVSTLTACIARRLLKVRFVNLINILADKEIIPELLQEKCTVDTVVDMVKELLENPYQGVEESLQKLGLGSNMTPSEKMAKVLSSMALDEARERKKRKEKDKK